MGDERKTKDAPRWAADEPTAMWDGSSLEEQGLREEQGRDASKEPAAPPPAASPAAPQRSGLSWPVTIGVAITVAVAVYFVVRALRG